MDETDVRLMRQAIEQAKRSPVARADDPMVGAVVRGAEGTVESAHRSEKAAGDHAEFTLLQKKVRSKDILAGATLYSTLEPCTARNHDKRPCANWIIERSIRRVFIGMLDPNRNIRGEGYWRLVEAGIEVEFFPYELAREILSFSREFINSHRAATRFDPTFAAFVESHKSPLLGPY